MKLKLSLQKEPKHSDLVSCVGWGSATELYSIGDDHQILKWDFQTGDTSLVVQLPKDNYATDVHWFPQGAGSKKQSNQSDLFVLACTDGTFLLVSRLGRVEKAVEAHRGAVLGTVWSHDGSALLTFGEDGLVKIWSRSGMLRTIIAQSSSPVYSACWSPDGDQVLYTSGRSLVVKPLQPSSKLSQWKAHDGLVLCADWSAVRSLIVSGGEDRKYKVWDSYGRSLYSSFLHDSPIASLSWSPDGELFAVGAFNTLRLCDKTGWSHSLEKPATGTVLKISWTADGTQFAGAAGNGQVVFAQVVERHLEWNNLEATVNGDNSIDVRDVTNESKEHLEFHDRVIKTSLAWGHLIVTTPTQCYIYNCRNWTTPVTMDLRSGAVNLILQASRHFLVAESITGLQIFSYEGRLVSSIKYPGLQLEALDAQTVSMCGDAVAIRDKKDEKLVRVFDAASGKEETREGLPLRHQLDITALSLSNAGPAEQRMLAFTDKNYDLYIAPILATGSNKPTSLGSMVSSVCWNDGTNMLAAMQDNRLTVWYHPAIVYSDKDLLPVTLVHKEGSEFSRSPQLLSFIGNHCTLRRSDGALTVASVSPFPAILHQNTAAGKWDAAVKLCRFVKEPALWGCLAGMAASARDLNTAEVAYAAINEVDKVQYIAHIKQLASAERRNAELALFCHQPMQAEATYLQAGMIYRAIELNITLFNWERAMELAVQHKTHVDTVLAFRERYLEEVGCQETLQRFMQYSSKLTIDWEKINAKITLEEEKELH